VRTESFRRWIVAGALVALATGCEQSAGPSPAVPELAGEWAGRINHSLAGDGALTLSVSQRGPGLFGQWTSEYPDPAFNQQGSFSATITGAPFVMFLRPTAPIVCSADRTLTGTLTVNTTLSADRLSGPFTILHCAGVLTGRVEVSRR
jgi:hypothetical protein